MEYTLQDKAIIAMVTQTNLTYMKIKRIIETLEDVSIIFNGDAILQKLDKILSKDELASIYSVDIDVVNNYIAQLAKKQIDIITILSRYYSYKLQEIYNPPLLLYAKGNLQLLEYDATLAVVGTRRCTNYGQEVTKSFTRVLARDGVCIISGLADGIDSIAHEAALEVKGKTIAVMGSGFDHIYPACNANLLDKIVANGGLIITEYAPDEKPQNFHFPARNRIVAGLSMAVLVVEAPKKSGALITKDYAIEYNREVFVVPGRINDIYSKGSNEIIKSCQGSIVLEPNDILEFFGKVSPVQQEMKVDQLSIEERLILDILDRGEKHYEELLSMSKLTSSALNSLLIKMELKGKLKKLPGNMYTSAII